MTILNVTGMMLPLILTIVCNRDFGSALSGIPATNPITSFFKFYLNIICGHNNYLSYRKRKALLETKG